MFRRDAYVLLALAVLGIVFTVYAVIGATPFFPMSLQAQSGVCPAGRYSPAEHRLVMHDTEAEWYSNALVGLHERPLFQDRNGAMRTVRLTLIPSSGAPLMVRTTETGDGRVRLIAKSSDGYLCGSTTASCPVDRVLTGPEQARLVAAQAFLQKPSYGCSTGVDGDMWLIEASGRGDYRFWSAWSPENGDDLRGFATVMLDLTGWRF